MKIKRFHFARIVALFQALPVDRPAVPPAAKSAVIGASLAGDLERLAQRLGWNLSDLMKHIRGPIRCRPVVEIAQRRP
jgi:hypothetical protein